MLSTVEQCLGLLGDAKFSSKLDATFSFHQAMLSSDSQLYTTLITPFGRYCFLRLPFGNASAPEYFQKQMSRILKSQAGVLNMIDDILVFGKIDEEHDQCFQQVLDRLFKAGITLNCDKCSFSQFLGLIVSAQGISPDQDKVAAIKRMPPLKDVSSVRHLLGLVNQVCCFLPNVSDITALS